MKINIISPFSLDMKYGVELNRCIEVIPEDDWICVLDWDCMLLSHKQVATMQEYITLLPETGLFLAKSNRSGSHAQRYRNEKSKNYDISYWMRIADEINLTYSVSEPEGNTISGFLMLFSKKTWNEIKFDENLDILHIDRTFAAGVLNLQKKIFIMDDVLVFHAYRLLNGTKDKTHLIKQ